MPVACFYNFSDFSFTWSWGGESMAFKPKEKKFMPAFLAQHFAKHLVNRELHRMGLDHECSPKAPEDAPTFNKLFRTAYIRERILPGGKKNSLVDMVEAVDRNFREEIQPEIAAIPQVNVLALDEPPVVSPRELADQEDPNFTREGSWDSGEVKGSKTKGQSDQPLVVMPPDFDDVDDEGYEGVPISPIASETETEKISIE